MGAKSVVTFNTMLPDPVEGVVRMKYVRLVVPVYVMMSGHVFAMYSYESANW